MTLDHKTSHKGRFFEIDIYISSVFEILLFKYLESEGAKNINIEKIAFKIVKNKFLAMCMTNQKMFLLYLS